MLARSVLKWPITVIAFSEPFTTDSNSEAHMYHHSLDSTFVSQPMVFNELDLSEVGIVGKTVTYSGLLDWIPFISALCVAYLDSYVRMNNSQPVSRCSSTVFVNVPNDSS